MEVRSAVRNGVLVFLRYLRVAVRPGGRSVQPGYRSGPLQGEGDIPILQSRRLTPLSGCETIASLVADAMFIVTIWRAYQKKTSSMCIVA